MKTNLFDEVFVANFWEKSEYAEREYVDLPVTPEVVARVERELQYKLPSSYVDLMRHQNGGIPKRTNHRTTEPTSWANDHIAITGIYSIGSAKRCSLLGEVGSRFWMERWGYPSIGVYFADCPSAGHDMLCLDYSQCGPDGDPTVVHVDQEFDYKITLVASSFENFVHSLEDDEAFEMD